MRACDGQRCRQTRNDDRVLREAAGRRRNGPQNPSTADALVDQRRLSVSTRPQSVSESPNHIGPNSASDGVGTSPPLPRTTGPLDNTVRFNSGQLRSDSIQIFFAVVGLIMVFALLKPQFDDRGMIRPGLQLQVFATANTHF